MLAVTGCGGVSVKLGEYKGLALKKVTEEEYQTEIQSMLETYATLEEVEEAAAEGDTVNINCAGFIDGVQFEGGTNDTEEGYDLVLGSGSFIPGFEDGLIGKKAGDEVALDLTFPDTYKNADYAGKAALFNVTVNAVKRTVVPELDLELAEQMGFTTIEELEDRLREELEKESYQNQIGEQLMESCTVKNVPQDEIDKLTDQMYSTYSNYISSLASAYGGVDEATILYYYTGYTSFEELKNYAAEYATNNVKYQYIIKEIAKKEKISVSDEEYDERARSYAKSYNYDNYEKFVTDYGEDTIKDAILMDMVIEFIIANAEIF